MIQLKRLARRSSLLVLVMAFGFALAVPALWPNVVSASTLPTGRSIQVGSDLVNANTTDANGVAYAAGAGGNGAQTYYKISFQLTAADSTNMGAMAFMFCTTPFAGTTCTDPGTTTLLNTASVASVAAQTGFTGGAWSLDTTTTANTNYFAAPNACSGTGTLRNNCILVKRTAAADAAAGTTVSITFGTTGGWIRNPDAAGTYYVRISTFNATDTFTTAALNDEGAAAFAIISLTVDITSKVQEQLTFSVGITYTAPGSTCAALTGGGALAIGDGNGALSTATPYGGHAYWRVYTNANNGTAIQYSADTLKTTTGYSIAAAGTSALTIANGVEKFGFGLDPNDGNQSLGNFDRFPTAVAPDVYDGANSSNINTAAVALDVASVTSPKNMATQSTPGPVTCATGSNYYVASASTTTKPGIYKTSFTYIATPTF